MPSGCVALFMFIVNVLGGKMSFLVLRTQPPDTIRHLFVSFLIVDLTLWHGRLGDTRHSPTRLEFDIFS